MDGLRRGERPTPKNSRGRQSNIERSNEEEAGALGRLFVRFDLLRDRVKIRPFSGFEFGVNEFTVDANFKSTSARGDQFHRLDPGDVANLGRQTGRPRFVVSSCAIFDRDACFHRAPLKSILSVAEEWVNPRTRNAILKRAGTVRDQAG